VLDDGSVDFGSKYGRIQLRQKNAELKVGMQILRIMNLEDDHDNVLCVRSPAGVEFPLVLDKVGAPNGGRLA
jgi:hypothetical protein